MPTTDQLWLISAGATALLGAALLAVFLRGDPARGRRRCPRCWYELSPGTDGCAECGRRLRRPREALRTRRRRRLLLPVATLWLLALGSAAAPLVRSGQWVAHTPTPVLDLLAGLYGHDGREIVAYSSDWLRSESPWERAVIAAHLGREVERERSGEMAALVATFLGDEARVLEWRVAPLLADPDPAMRIAAMRTLAATPGAADRWWRALAERLESDPEAVVRLEAVWLLGRWSDGATGGPGWGPLVTGLDDADADVRRSAAAELLSAPDLPPELSERAHAVQDAPDPDPEAPGSAG